MLFIESIEAVKCLDEGVIETAADANIGSILGIGFPGWTGGVLQYIDGYEGAAGSGPAGFVARARELANSYGERFEPPASLVEKAERGETLQRRRSRARRGLNGLAVCWGRARRGARPPQLSRPRLGQGTLELAAARARSCARRSVPVFGCALVLRGDQAREQQGEGEEHERGEKHPAGHPHRPRSSREEKCYHAPRTRVPRVGTRAAGRAYWLVEIGLDDDPVRSCRADRDGRARRRDGRARAVRGRRSEGRGPRGRHLRPEHARLGRMAAPRSGRAVRRDRRAGLAADPGSLRGPVGRARTAQRGA